jgi:hypothetical protein
MRKLMENVRGGSKVVHLLHVFLVIFLVSATCVLAQSVPPSPSTGQPSQAKAPLGKSAYSHANDLAALSRAGNVDATNQLAREPFRNAAIPTEVADAFGFTDRIAQAEIAYRQGSHPAVHEEDVVKAVNNLATTLGTPAWTHTTQAEVRRLRVRLFATLPKLFANHEPPDSKGHYRLLSPNMSPSEASYIATTMLYMKVFYSDFQFTEAEQAQNRNLDPAVVAATQRQREGQMLDVVQGRSSTVSIIDLLAASDQLFTDLGIPAKETSSAQKIPPPAPGVAAAKGGI